MKQRFRYAALALPALMLLAATCVGDTHQRGPAGPWVGEVTNYGADPVPGAYVTADVFTADGSPLGREYVYTCPATIPPGGHGTFELFVATSGDEKLPLRATFAPVALPGAWGGEAWEGFSTRLVSTNPAKRVAMVEVGNDSGLALDQMRVCGNIRDASGALLEVGSTRMFPTVLRPGQSQTVPIFFNSMPAGDLTFEFSAQGACCSGASTFDPSDFQITAARITDGPAGRMLVVAGEMRNRSGRDLQHLRMEAYDEDAPELRVGADLGCQGIVGFDGKAAAIFAIPVGPNVTEDDVRIAGIQADPSNSEYAIETSDVTMARLPDQPDGLGSVAIGAMLHNPTAKWLNVHAACATVRDRQGHAIGVVQLRTGDGDASPYAPLLPPGAIVKVTGAGYVVDTPASANAQAYGELRDFGPIP
jgi:hypothetical protein